MNNYKNAAVITRIHVNVDADVPQFKANCCKLQATSVWKRFAFVKRAIILSTKTLSFTCDGLEYQQSVIYYYKCNPYLNSGN